MQKARTRMRISRLGDRLKAKLGMKEEIGLLGYKVISARSPKKWVEAFSDCVNKFNDPRRPIPVLFRQYRAKALVIFDAHAPKPQVIAFTTFTEGPKTGIIKTISTFVRPKYRRRGKGQNTGKKAKTAGLATKLTLRLIAMARRKPYRVKKIMRRDLGRPLMAVHRKLHKNTRNSSAESIPNPMESYEIRPKGKESDVIIRPARRKRGR